MTYIQIHKGKSLILLALLLIALCVVVLLHIRPGGMAVFSTCAQAKSAGYSNIPKGNHFYNPALDRDKDGIACE